MASAYWVSVAGVERDEILRRAGLVETGEATTMAGWMNNQRDVGVVLQPSGRVLLLSYSSPLEDDDALRMTTGGGEAFGGAWSSVASVASFAAYANGQKLWSIENDSDDDGEDILKSEGPLPPEVDAIVRQAEADGDLWAGITDVSARLTGYEPEGDSRDGGLEVRFVAPAAVAAKRAAKAAHKAQGGFFSRLFGGR